MTIDKALKVPFYVKASLIIIGLYAFVSMLYVAEHIIVPFVFAVIVAIVLHPVVNFFVRLKINRILAIVISLILSITAISALGALIFSQISRFSESWPKLVDKFTDILNQTSHWASGYFNISPYKITAWIAQTKGELIGAIGSAIGQTLVNVGSGLVVMFIILIYIFMILVYQPLLLEFFRRLFGKRNRNEVSKVISQIKSLIQSYLVGLVIEAFIVATLYTVGLLLLGIEYALVLGIIGALLNVIPYLGAFAAVILPMLIALVTKTSPWYPLYVLALYYFVHLIDSNYLIPKVVASKVKINALVSIIAVIIGSALWGIPGMLLSIPIVAIIKVICDRIEPLKPVGFLLGDTMPALGNFNPRLEKK